MIDTKIKIEPQFAGTVVSSSAAVFYIDGGNTMIFDIKRREIYFADLSPIVGSEQAGCRPVLILQNNTGNEHSPTTIVAPITSRQKKNFLPTHVHINADCLEKNSIVLLEQIRTIDKTRLIEYVGKLAKDTMGQVDYAIIKSLGIKTMEEILK